MLTYIMGVRAAVSILNQWLPNKMCLLNNSDQCPVMQP